MIGESELGVATAYVKVRIGAAKQVGKALLVSFINQVLSSGTNFLLTVFFIRVLDASAFGIYGIAIAAVLLVSGLGNALVLTQMVVHLPDKAKDARAAYLGRCLIISLGLVSVLVIIALIYAILILTWGSRHDIAFIVLATSLSAAAYLLKDYFIRLAYSLRMELRALAINVAISSAVALALASIWYGGFSINALSAIEIYLCGQIAGALAGFCVFRSEIKMTQMTELRTDMREAFQGGRWAVGGVVTTWLQSQAYVYVTAILVGPAGVGFVNAARVFVSPLLMVLPAVNVVVVPRLASLRAAGGEQVANAGKMSTLFVGTLSLAYVGLLAFAYVPASSMLIGDKYKGVGALVAAWCAVAVFQVLRTGASTVLQALRKFRGLTVSGAVVAFLSIPVTAVLAITHGAIGAIVSTAIAEISFAIILWRLVNRYAKQY